MPRILAILFLLLLPYSFALAQMTPERLAAASTQAKDLEFPSEPATLSVFSGPRMALYKPDGAGPFPALVLFHQCGGLGSSKWQNMSMLAWAREAVARGYVAFLIDALGPRGVDTVCMGAKNGVHFPRGAKDALQAAAYLRKFDFVDKKRVALAGYSWGAMVGVLVSSKTWGESLKQDERFNAAVSFYPGCFEIKPPGGTAYEIVNPDIDRPLLVLMGGQDTETPAEECRAKLAPLKAAGAPIEMHLYPDATHCWDCENLNGLRKTDARGNSVLYRYDKDVTRDSTQRMFDFLQKNLAAGRP